MSDFVEGQKNMLQSVLQMLKSRPADEERGVTENKIQMMIDTMNAQADDRPVVGFVRMVDDIPDFENDCFGRSADEVFSTEMERANRVPRGKRYTVIPVYR